MICFSECDTEIYGSPLYIIEKLLMMGQMPDQTLTCSFPKPKMTKCNLSSFCLNMLNSFIYNEEFQWDLLPWQNNNIKVIHLLKLTVHVDLQYKSWWPCEVQRVYIFDKHYPWGFQRDASYAAISYLILFPFIEYEYTKRMQELNWKLQYWGGGGRGWAPPERTPLKGFL